MAERGILSTRKKLDDTTAHNSWADFVNLIVNARLESVRAIPVSVMIIVIVEKASAVNHFLNLTGAIMEKLRGRQWVVLAGQTNSVTLENAKATYVFAKKIPTVHRVSVKNRFLSEIFVSS